MSYLPAETRYNAMPYARTGNSGLKLPRLSLGLWHNFGGVDVFENSRKILQRAFDNGITHFDLANNYGPPAGSAEETMGEVLRRDFRSHRDELILSTKAGWGMWPGPYGDFGSRKYLIASLDQSLRRLGVDYVDIFYHHRPDPETPIEESMGALDQIVRSGKALYVGISSYSAEETRKAGAVLQGLGTPCLIHQPSYSILNRWVEDGLLAELRSQGIGCIAFSPLAQGLLTDRYLKEIPKDSRAAKPHGFLQESQVSEETMAKVRTLDGIARTRGQSLAQMAVSWVLRDPVVTSALVGVSRLEQLEALLPSVEKTTFSDAELSAIDLATR